MITAGPQLHIVEEVALTIANVPEQKYIERLSQSYKQRFEQTWFGWPLPNHNETTSYNIIGYEKVSYFKKFLFSSLVSD